MYNFVKFLILKKKNNLRICFGECLLLFFCYVAMTMSTDGTNFHVMYGAVIVTLSFDWLKPSSLILGPIFYIYLKNITHEFYCVNTQIYFVLNSGRLLLKVPLCIYVGWLYGEPLSHCNKQIFSEYASFILFILAFSLYSSIRSKICFFKVD